MVRVFVVTFRRHSLLLRALESVQGQTYQNWHCHVVNDDPEDSAVADLINKLSEPRISVLEPLKKRGAAGSFNLAFKATECDYSSLLEDDNWWDPRYLEVMLEALRSHPEVDLACCNERLWKENPDGSWIDTGQVIWSEKDNALFSTSLDIACGSAKICNSSLMVRRGGRPEWTTPDDIPVDVTEHFRERVLPQPILLVREPLVNYAETLHTNRSRSGSTWADYQSLLIGSCFASLPHNLRLEAAQCLLSSLPAECCPRGTSLLTASIATKEARALWKLATFRQKARFCLTAIRRPALILSALTVRKRLGMHWDFLVNSRWNESLADNREKMGCNPS